MNIWQNGYYSYKNYKLSIERSQSSCQADLKYFTVQLPVSSSPSAGEFKDARGQACSSLGIIGLQPPPDRFDWMSKTVSSR